MDKNKKIGVILTVVILVIVGIFVVVLLVRGSTPATFTVDGNILEISGSYGNTIDLEDAEISIISSIEVVSRNNGSNAGNALKGAFTVTIDSSDVQTYLNIGNTNDDYFIQIIDKNSDYYIVSAEDKESTKALYDEIIA